MKELWSLVDKLRDARSHTGNSDYDDGYAFAAVVAADLLEETLEAIEARWLGLQDGDAGNG